MIQIPDCLPYGWTECRADEVLTFKYGKGLPERNRRPGAVGVYASAGRVGEHDEALSERPVIVIGRKGAAGRVTIADEPSWTIDTAYYVEPPEDINLRFLAYQLEAEQLEALDQSTAIPSLSRDDLNALTIRIAPRAEQDRIVAVIETCLNDVAAALRSVEAAVSEGTVLRRSVFEQSIAEGDVLRVGDVVTTIEAGKSFRCQTRPAHRDEWGVIKVSAMTWGRFQEDENKAVLPGTEVDARREIKPGDLLLSRANTTEYVGASVLVRQCRPRLLLSDKSLRLYPADGIVPAWLHAALSAPSTRAQISEMATGTKDSMRNISQVKLRQVQIRVPSADSQRTIVADIDQQLQSLDQASAELNGARAQAGSLRRAILAKAMTGLVPQDPADKPVSGRVRRSRDELTSAKSEPESVAT